MLQHCLLHYFSISFFILYINFNAIVYSVLIVEEVDEVDEVVVVDEVEVVAVVARSRNQVRR